MVNKEEKISKEGSKEGEQGDDVDGNGVGDGDGDSSDMEKMLSELTSIVAPSGTPPDQSLSSVGQDSSVGQKGEEEDEDDVLAVMRERLEECMLEEPSEAPVDQGEEYSKDPLGKGEESSAEVPVIHRESPRDPSVGERDEELATAINVLPPTPTALKEMLGVGGGGNGQGAPPNVAALTVRGKFSTPSQPLDISSGAVSAVSKSDEDLTDQGTFYSPASTRNSPDLKKVSDKNRACMYSGL